MSASIFSAPAASGKKATGAWGCPKPSRPIKRPPHAPAGLRLQKFLAHCGVGSRRACERLIEAGRVTVDGRIVRQQGVCIDPRRQTIRFDGRRLQAERKVYLVLNKPRDVLCTAHDPQGRRTFRALLPDLGARVYTIGRLDRNSEGLLLVTNDGDLAQALAHPRHAVVKTYHAWIAAPLTPEQERRLRDGVLSDGERLATDTLDDLGPEEGGRLYRLRLHEGRNRHIRRMFEALGVPVLRLKRMAIGALTLGPLRSGAWRYLNRDEVERLRRSAGNTQARSNP